MEWFIAVLAVAALGVAAMVAAGGMGQMTREPVYDTYRQDLPDRPLAAEDIRDLRFGIALRGYAMGQVDDVLDRLAAEVAARDARITELTARAFPDSTPAAERQPPAAVGQARDLGSAANRAESEGIDPDGPRPPRAQYDAG